MGTALTVVEREGASVMWQNLRDTAAGRKDCYPREQWQVPIQCGGGFGGQGGNEGGWIAVHSRKRT